MAEARTITLDDEHKLHLVSAGRGPDALLFHGALATHQDWLAGPFDRLARLCRVTAIDRPGHGLSLRPRLEGSPREQAGQIRSALAKAGIERPVIVAHSFGAMVALAFAELFPDEARALLLVAPIAFPEPRIEHLLFSPRATPVTGPLLSHMARAADPVTLAHVQKLMFDPYPVPHGWQEGFPYDQVLEPMNMVAEGEDMTAMLPGSPAGMIDMGRITLPVSILTGGADKIVNNERHGRRLAAILPDARLREVEGSCHMVHQLHGEMVEEALAELLELVV